jgi:hypothetical protein
MGSVGDFAGSADLWFREVLRSIRSSRFPWFGRTRFSVFTQPTAFSPHDLNGKLDRKSISVRGLRPVALETNIVLAAAAEDIVLVRCVVFLIIDGGYSRLMGVPTPIAETDKNDRFGRFHQPGRACCYDGMNQPKQP